MVGLAGLGLELCANSPGPHHANPATKRVSIAIRSYVFHDTSPLATDELRESANHATLAAAD